MLPYARPASARHQKKYPCPVRDCEEELNSNDDVIIHLRAMHADALNRSLTRRMQMQNISTTQIKKRVNDGPAQPRKKKADPDHAAPISTDTVHASSSDRPAQLSKNKKKVDHDYAAPISTDTVPASSSDLPVAPLFSRDPSSGKKDEGTLLHKFEFKQYQPDEHGKISADRKKRRYNPLKRPENASTSKKPAHAKPDVVPHSTFRVVNGYYKEFITYEPAQHNETGQSSHALPQNAPVLNETTTQQATEPQSLPHPSSVNADGGDWQPITPSHPSDNGAQDHGPALDEGVTYQAAETQSLPRLSSVPTDLNSQPAQLPDMVSTFPSWDEGYAYGNNPGFQDQQQQQQQGIQQSHDDQPPSYVQEPAFTSTLPQAYTWDQNLNIPGLYSHQQIAPMINPLGCNPMVKPSAFNVQQVNPQAIQTVDQWNPTMPLSMISGYAAPQWNRLINSGVYPTQNQPMYSGMYPMQNMAGLTPNMLQLSNVPMNVSASHPLMNDVGVWDPVLGDFVYKTRMNMMPGFNGSGYSGNPGRMDNSPNWNPGMNTMSGSYSLPDLQNQQMPEIIPMTGDGLLTESELLAYDQELFGDPFSFCP